ncbi:MAG TPA: hypothetical protein VG056_00545 [Pirellulales bacterium]|nr:hypothetical protein [Pirellulales bacterium]
MDVVRELRVGTVVRAAGFEFFRHPFEKGRNLTWNPDLVFQMATPAFHAVKTLNHNLK